MVKPDVNVEAEAAPEENAQPKAPKTEIFENFEILEEKQEEPAKHQKVFSFAPAPKAPSFDFLDELKQKLEKRQTEINAEDEAVYKEFDSKLNKFVEISKEDRDQKEVKHKEAIEKIEQEETKKRREIQKI